jgi:LysM repeat protein
MKKTFITLFGLAALAPAWSQDAASARLAYQDRQTLAEVPRLVQQFDVLVENQEQIAARLVKVESGSGDTAELRAEIDKLRGEIAELRAAVRREQDAMRREIVADLAKRISTLTPPPPPPAPAPVHTAAPARAPAAPPPPPPEIGPHYEYIVEKGQTLSLIADGFRTTVPKILAANPGLKPNLLRVGQKLIIPAEDVPQQQPKKGGRGKK